jgi:hypothetical protein
MKEGKESVTLFALYSLPAESGILGATLATLFSSAHSLAVSACAGIYAICVVPTHDLSVAAQPLPFGSPTWIVCLRGTMKGLVA